VLSLFSKIIYEKEGGIAKITVNRPEVLNAMDAQTANEVLSALKDAELDENVRVVVLTGAGDAFGTGADLKEASLARDADPLDIRLHIQRVFNEIVLQIFKMEKPVIAAVNGIAAGASMNIALVCDLVIASDQARFSEIFAHIGFIPDAGGTFLLPRLVGVHKAKELSFTARFVTAEEAEKLGLVNMVVPRDQLDDAVKKVANEIMKFPGKAIGAAKKAINMALTSTLEDALNLEATTQALCSVSREAMERIRSFLEKRSESKEK